MANAYEDFLKFGKAQSGMATSSAAFSKNLQTVAAEATDYSKKSLENSSAFLEKMRAAKSFDSAIQIQSEYAKTSYAGFVSQATKIGELYSNLVKAAFKPLELALLNVKGRK
jgi:hypothetical protein